MTPNLKSAISTLCSGKVLLLIDDGGPSPRGYLVASAASVNKEQISFLVNVAGGLVCAALSAKKAADLGIPLMTSNLNLSATPDFMVSVEARKGVSTGISASDRAHTLRTLAETSDLRRDLVMPGHIFPARAKSGGVLVRNAITEAVTDLLALAGLPQVGVFCHCLADDGSFRSIDSLVELAKDHNLCLLYSREIVQYRLQTEPILRKVAEANLPTSIAGELKAVCFQSTIDQAEHLALVKGELQEFDAKGQQLPILVRVQSEQHLNDLFGVEPGSGRRTAETALELINRAKRGIFVYIRHPRFGLMRKEVEGKSTALPSAFQLREYGIGAQILNALGARRIILLTNSKYATEGFCIFNLDVIGQERLS